MKIFYNYLFSLFLLFFSLQVFAQNQRYDQVVQIIPPSPDAISLGKYGAIPVSLYSGLPQVNIPLYSTKEGDIDINIGLSYMSGGVKVEEIASWVGLGWTLNAGGAIVRSVRGRSDDGGGGYFDPNLMEGSRPTGTSNNMSDLAKWRLSVAADDGESDIYYFNFDNYTGSFYFDTNKKPHFLNHTNLKVIPYISHLTLDSFKVVNEKGVEYLFDQREFQSSASKSWTTYQGPPAAYTPNAKEYTSAWYLSRIKSPQGFQVKFEYDQHYSVYDVLGNERSYTRKDVPYTIFYLPFEKQGVKSLSLMYLTLKRLKKIVFSNGYIELNKGTDRTDIEGMPTLDNITVYNNAKSLRKMAFSYHYYSNRLMLDKIQESSGDKLSKPPYQFHYNESKNLPDRKSYAQDHWGYYNGHVENTTLIPAFSLDGKYVKGANRNVDTTFNKLGVLGQIDYPTKGSTVIEYEPNVANNILNYPLYTQKEQSYIRFTYPATVSVPNWFTPVLVPTDTLTFTVNTAGTAATGAQINGVMADISMKIPYNYNKTQTGSIGFVGSQYELWDVTAGKKILTNADFGNPVSSQEYSKGNVAYNYIMPTKTFLQKDHTYRLIHFVKPDVYNRFNAFPYYFSIIYQEDIMDVNKNLVVGGLRVKNITDVDPVSLKKIKKSYSYNDGVSSTGYLLDYPRYFYDYSDSFKAILLGGGCCTPDKSYDVNVFYKVALSSSHYPLATTKNAYLGYKQVTEITNDSLKTVYKYTSAADFDNQDRYEWNGLYLPISANENMINGHPEAQYRSFDWKRGLLTQKSDYKFVNDAYVPVRVEDHYYSTNNSSDKPNYHEAYNYTSGIFKNDWYGFSSGPLNTMGTSISPYTLGFPDCTLNAYRNDTGYTQEDSTIVRSYHSLDLSKVSVVKTEMLYDTLTLQPRKIIVKQSNGDTRTTNYIYPPNYDLSLATGSAALGIKNLVQKNIFNEPVETYTSNQVGSATSVISGEIKSYRSDVPKIDTVFVLDVPGSISNFVPSTITSGYFTKNSHYIPKYIFNKYDNYSNLLEGAYVNGARSSYIWGYKQQYPIAKVYNAAYKDVFHENFEDGNGNSTIGDAKTGNYSKSGGYTKSLVNLTNGKYTLTYWIKSSDSWSLVITNNIDVTNSSYKITISDTYPIDDIRFSPSDTQMVTYTYDPLVGMTSQTDTKGLTTYYEYDELQRMKLIRDQNKNIIKSYNYNYYKN